MFISVIVPTWKRAAILKGTLDSLAAQRPLDGGEAGFAVIVVSDGEDEATRELARSYDAMPVEWIFHAENLGLPAARNTGAARARGDILLFLDDDTSAAAGLLGFHAEAHERAHQCPASEGGQRAARERKVAVCGRIVESAVHAPKTKTAQWLEKAWMETLELFEAARAAPDTDRIPAEAVSMSCFGLNCSISRELFHAVGGFNSALRWMDEEMELGCRLYMRGVQFVNEPRAVVVHRNDKELVAYYERCWRLGGSDDVLRALRMGEHNAQTRQLLGLDSGPLLARMANRAFWYGNGAARGLSAMLKKVTDRTGSRASFRLWQETTQLQRYWEAVRESGVRRGELRELAGHPLRVLMLHSIAEPRSAQEESYYLSPERWRRLLETMKEGGYHCADPVKLQDPSATWGERELVLTFDDGYDDFYTEVFPLLEKYRLKPLVFLPVNRIGDENRWDQANGLRARRLMDTAQIRELRRHGVRFGSHTLTHPSLVRLGDAQLRRELVESRRKLEELLGDEVDMLAYPYGHANPRVRAAAIEAGYKMAFTTVDGLNVWEDPFAMRRIEFNQALPPALYRWKLRSGHGPRSSVKNELAPLYRMIPRELKARIRALRT